MHTQWPAPFQSVKKRILFSFSHERSTSLIFSLWRLKEELFLFSKSSVILVLQGTLFTFSFPVKQEARNSANVKKSASPEQYSQRGASECYTPFQHLPPAAQEAQDTSHRHRDSPEETIGSQEANQHSSLRSLCGADNSTAVMINRRVQDTLDALVRKFPSPGDAHKERRQFEDRDGNLQKERNAACVE